MSFTLIVVHLGARVNPLTLPIVLPSVKSIMVRVVCPLQCGQYLVRCRPEFVRFLNLINGSHGFVCDANPSSGLWLDAVWWKSAECQSIFRSLLLSVDDSGKRILWISKMLPEYTTSRPMTKQSSLCPDWGRRATSHIPFCAPAVPCRATSHIPCCAPVVPFRANLHIPYCVPAVTFRANSHIQCCAPAVPCHANSHIPCCAPAVPCRANSHTHTTLCHGRAVSVRVRVVAGKITLLSVLCKSLMMD